MVGRPRKNENEKAKPYDRIICDICNKEFVRSHRSDHKKTNYHKMYADINENIKGIVINQMIKKQINLD